MSSNRRRKDDARPMRPNIVYVMMDDIAEAGIRFDQMYSPAPICSPARCGLLTGRYPQRCGIPRVLYPEDEVGLRGEDRTVAEHLRDSGYATCCIGK